MKVLFYAPLAVLSYHLETDLELIKKHQDSGDEVLVINCNGALKPTGFAGCKGALRCAYCKSKSDEGLKLLNVPQENIFTIDLKKYSHADNYNFQTLRNLKDYTYKEADIGMAVASTLVSNLREPNPDMLKSNGYIREALNTTKATHDYINDFLDKHKPDLIYFFNGRFAMYNPILRIAQKKNIKFYVHERAGVLKRYSLSENTSPHDLDYINASIHKVASQTTPAKIEEIGGPWFEARINKQDDSWYSFVTKQTRHQLPVGFDVKKRNIAIFISSEDEFECMPGWDNPLFRNQADAITHLANQFKNKTQFHFYIRLHPNLAGLNNAQTQFFKNFKEPNMTVIRADESVDTYALIKASEKAISFGTTVGLEAAYSKRPSILVGRAWFESLKCFYKPKTRDEFYNLIEQNLPALDNTEAIKYSYWIKNWGEEFKYFQPQTLSSGLFLGHKIQGNKLLMYIGYFFYFLLEIKAVLTGKLSATALVNKVKNKL